jgi:large subunit ribosomal protein L2
MGMKKLKPTSPGNRNTIRPDFAEVTAGRPEKSLVVGKTRISGRNNVGNITMRRRGGGHKRRYRVIDFKRDKVGVPATVATIEYDPNRTARIALLHYADGEKRYILAPVGLGVGDTVVSSAHADIKPGNCLKIKHIPLGTILHNVRAPPKQGWSARSECRRGRTAHGEGGQVCHASSAERRVPQDSDGVPRDGWPSGQQRAWQPEVGEGGSQPLVGPSSEGSRLGDEPRRSPSRWW